MKKSARLLTFGLSLPLLLSACNGSLITRAQAIQSLKLIEPKLASLREDRVTTFAQLYVEIVQTHVESHIEIIQREVYELSTNSKVAKYSKKVTRGEELRVTNQVDNEYFIKDGYYYSSEYSLTLNPDNTYTTVLERTGTKNKEKAISYFAQSLYTLQETASNALLQYDNIGEKIDTISSFSSLETPKIIRDRYSSKGNGHIYAEISRYTSTSRKTLASEMKFAYDKYLLNEYSIYDYRNDNFLSVTAKYSLILQTPNTFDIPDEETSEASSLHH